jgi:uncharacterized protein YceH (UPF0502 family)
MSENEQAAPQADTPEELRLTFEEARVLGCLIEKERTTPEYYPLSMNALKSGCNQKSNRDPVVAFSEDTLEEALQGLREKRLAVLVHTADGRVPRFRHTLEQRLSLTDPEVAVLCVLLLRGPQTPGELRGRTGRMHVFEQLSEVSRALDSLMHETRPSAVCKLPREAGRKEARYAHLLCGEPDVQAAPPVPEPEPPPAVDATLEARIALLEAEVAELRAAHQHLKAQLGGEDPPPFTA